MIKGEKQRIFWILIGVMIVSSVDGQGKRNMTREEYITNFSELAMKEMARVGIPASITLAQGCLESKNGNSRLAVKGNNHFGIKCHDWDGRRIFHDDDEKGECFRSYSSAYDSYIDHSTFLTTKSRYASLFDLKPGDYKKWAHGLKRAGYATAPKYADLLIRIIEENVLCKYDNMVLNGSAGAGEDGDPQKTGRDYDTGRSILVNNKIEYILVGPGDTPESLREELDLYPNEIYRYNNLKRGVILETGQIIYLQPKKRRAAPGNEIHVVENGQTMLLISQKYGVKLKSLYRFNLMIEGEQPATGAEISLRRGKKEPILKTEPATEPHDEEEMKFIFEN